MSLEGFKSAIMSLIFVVLVAGALVLAIDTFNSELVLDVPASTATSERLDGAVLNTAKNLANDWTISISSVTVEWNSTHRVNSSLDPTNYSLGNSNTYKKGTFTLLDNTTGVADNCSGKNFFVTYTYHNEQATVATNATGEGLTGSANASNYFATIGTLIGVFALIGVIVGAFYLAKR